METPLFHSDGLPKIPYTLSTTPWYFGAYLNQARHNLFLALNALTIKLEGNPIANDDQINSNCKAITILNQTNNPVALLKAMEPLEEDFPGIDDQVPAPENVL